MDTKTKQFLVVPDGEYLTAFVGIKEQETKYGSKLRWTFKIIQGEYKNKTISELTKPDNPTINNRFGKFLCSLDDILLEVGAEITPEKHIGKLYKVKVANKQLMSFSKWIV
jgi:hypothetical protein